MHKKSLATQLTAWSLYDLANTAINTIVFTFIFSVYFARGIYGDEVAGSAAWSFMMGCAGVAVAILSPIIGAIVDHGGHRKPALALFTSLSVLLCGALYFMAPDKNFVMPALLTAAALSLCYELAQNIYGSTLPIIAPPEKIGLVSGLGWGTGYIGSIFSLGFVLFAFIGLGDAQGFLNLPTDQSLNVRASVAFASIWFAIFALPYFFICPDAPATGVPARTAIRQSFKHIKSTLKSAYAIPGMLRFLIAAAIYRDGLITLFAVGGLYAAGTLNMDFSDIMLFAIAMNVTGGIGALTLAKFDDKIGSRNLIIISLCALIFLGGILVSLNDKTAFILTACALGAFIGPVQAASRSMLVRLSPPSQTGAFFGLYALTGKSVAFLGPFAFAFVTATTGSQRLGIATILLFWLIGLLIILSIRPNNKL